MLGAQRRHLGQSPGRDQEWRRERVGTRKEFLEERPGWSAVPLFRVQKELSGGPFLEGIAPTGTGCDVPLGGLMRCSSEPGHHSEVHCILNSISRLCPPIHLSGSSRGGDPTNSQQLQAGVGPLPGWEMWVKDPAWA